MDERNLAFETKYAQALEGIHSGLLLCETVGDAVWLDNQVYRLLSMPLGIPTTFSHLNAILFSQTTSLLEMRTTLCETKVKQSEIFHLLNCRGEKNYIRVSFMMSSDSEQELIAVFEDKTTEIRAENSLKDQFMKMDSILGTVVDAIITIDSRGTIESFNKAAERMFGYKAEDVIHCNINLLMPEPFRSQHDDHLRRYHATREAKIIGLGREVIGLRADGSTFPMDLAVSEVKLLEQSVYTGILRDISERKKILVEQQHEQIQKAGSSALSSMSQLASSFSHDINTPLECMNIGIKLLSRLVEIGMEESKMRDALASLANTYEKLKDITANYKALSHGFSKQDEEILPLFKIIEMTKSLIGHKFNEHDIEFEFVDLENMSSCIKCNLVDIVQTLIHIILNAFDAVHTVENPKVCLSLHETDDSIVFTIADNGKGIEPEHMERLTEPFFTTKGGGHSGLGLCFAEKASYKYGGTLDFRSTLGLGTTVMLKLPKVL